MPLIVGKDTAEDKKKKKPNLHVGLWIPQKCTNPKVYKSALDRKHYRYLCTSIVGKNENFRSASNINWLDPDISEKYREKLITVVEISHETLIKLQIWSFENIDHNEVNTLVNYSYHLGISAIIFKLPRTIIYQLLEAYKRSIENKKYGYYWICLKLSKNYSFLSTTSLSFSDTWNTWNRIKTLVPHHRLAVILELANITEVPTEEEMARWKGDSVRGIVVDISAVKQGISDDAKNVDSTASSISTDSYDSEKEPDKCRKAIEIIKMFFPLKCDVIIKSEVGYSNLWKQSRKWLKNLYADWDLNNKEKEKDEKKTKIFHINPTQLLKRFLRSTGEATNYSFKQQFFRRSLLSNIISRKKMNNNEMTIIIVGISYSMFSLAVSSLKKMKSKATIFILEEHEAEKKLFDQKYKHHTSKKISHRVISFQEAIQLGVKADIIIVDYLGSFADIRFYPELVKASRYFLKESGCFIPEACENYLSPVMSDELYNRVLDLETPCRTFTENMYEIDEPKTAFKYYSNEITDIQQSISLQFKPKLDCMMHGLMGYFKVIVQRSVFKSEVSIGFDNLPYSKNKSNALPIFFPFKEPAYLKAGEDFSIKFSRLRSENRMWYQWNIVKPPQAFIQNKNGCQFYLDTGSSPIEI